MVCASRLAERRGLIGSDVTARQIALLTALRLPTELPHGSSFTADAAIARMRLDKKAIAGQLRFVLPVRLGHVETIAGVPEAHVEPRLAQIAIF